MDSSPAEPARLRNLIAFYNRTGYVIRTAGGEEVAESVMNAHLFVIQHEAREKGRKLAQRRGVKFVGEQYRKTLD